MKKVCRGCYNSRLLIMAKVQTRHCALNPVSISCGTVVRIRAKGGLEELDPSMKMRKECTTAFA